MKKFIIDIRNHLFENVPELKHIAVYNGQLDRIDGGQDWAFAFPCAFIEMQVINIGMVGRYSEDMSVNMTIHIGHEFYNGDRMDENLEVFDLKQKIYLALKTFQGDNSSTLNRIRDEQDFDSTNVYHFRQTYEFNLIDDSAEPETIEHKASLSLTAEYE